MVQSILVRSLVQSWVVVVVQVFVQVLVVVVVWKMLCQTQLVIVVRVVERLVDPSKTTFSCEV